MLIENPVGAIQRDFLFQYSLQSINPIYFSQNYKCSANCLNIHFMDLKQKNPTKPKPHRIYIYFKLN